MTAEQFSDALGDIDGRYIGEVLEYKSGRTDSRISRNAAIILIAAALSALLLGCAVVQSVRSGGIGDLFSQYFERQTGEEPSAGQAELIGRLSQELNMSAASDGVTVTLDSAAVGDDCVYLLVKIEGESLSKRRTYYPAPPDVVLPDGYGEAGYMRESAGEPNSYLIKFMFIRSDESKIDTESLDLTLTFRNIYEIKGSEDRLFAQGEWRFELSLDRPDLSEPVRLPNLELTVTDFDGEERDISLRNIEITSTGMRWEADDPGSLIGVKVTAITRSGAEVERGLATVNFLQWRVPIDLSSLEAVEIGGVRIEVPLAPSSEGGI